jgi:hypothetical protein
MVTLRGNDSVNENYAVIDRPRLKHYAGELFVEGYHAKECAEYVRGRRILIPLRNVITITELDATADVWKSPQWKRRKT